MAYNPNAQPSVSKYFGFKASEDAEELRTAMNGTGTNERVIFNILTKRTNSQRQEIRKHFTEKLERDLIDDLKTELGKNFEELIIALMMRPEQYLCKQLHRALDGTGRNESTLVEILCTKSNADLKKISETYEDMYRRQLVEHLCSESDGEFRRLLKRFLTIVRDETFYTFKPDVKDQAEALHGGGKVKLGTNGDFFSRVFTHLHYVQLRAVFELYKKIAGRTIEQAVDSDMRGHMKEAILAMIECVHSTPAFFAKRLHTAMSGEEADEMALIRMIVTRSEVDLQDIKEEYEKLYDQTLMSAVKGEATSGYRHVLCGLIDETDTFEETEEWPYLPPLRNSL